MNIDNDLIADYNPPKVIDRLVKDVDLSPYDEFVKTAAEENNLDPEIIKAVILKESAGKPKAGSSKGAKGLMQLTSIAVRDLGLDDKSFDYYDPETNIKAGSKFLAKMIDTFDGNLTLGLAAYNAGIWNVRKHNGVPPFKETEDYVRAIQYMYTQM